jgi:site-specific DNA-cytosine methylase
LIVGGFMKVLVACEFSGSVRDAFLKRGIYAMSCDLEPCDSTASGDHYQGNVLDILDHGWDLMIAHPPCTHLAVSGARHFAKKRADGRQQQGIDFFMALANCDIPRYAIENPIGIMSTVWRKPDQIIQPWEYGHEAQKSTCLWLRGLPELKPTNIVDKGEFVTFSSGKRMTKWYADAAKHSPKERERIRNKTFQGIADAMAQQWGDLL